MFDLSEKIALVTGASGGIGSEIARILHSHGATVALSGTKIESLEFLKNELKERVQFFPCDLSDKNSIENLTRRIEDSLGMIDILINNAGLTKDNLFIRINDDDWESVMKVNLDAPFRIMRHCVRNMIKKNWGRIINITSVVGFTGNSGQGNYCASKAGLVGITRALALEVAKRGITVNCVAPGFIGTAMTEKLSDNIKANILNAIPTGTMGSTKDIAAAVLYLASNEAAYVTGHTLHVNGGMYMN